MRIAEEARGIPQLQQAHTIVEHVLTALVSHALHDFRRVQQVPVSQEDVEQGREVAHRFCDEEVSAKLRVTQRPAPLACNSSRSKAGRAVNSRWQCNSTLGRARRASSVIAAKVRLRPRPVHFHRAPPIRATRPRPILAHMIGIGARIAHPKYGEGAIFGESGAAWRIFFQEHGEKELAKTYESYEVVEPAPESGEAASNSRMSSQPWKMSSTNTSSRPTPSTSVTNGRGARWN